MRKSPKSVTAVVVIRSNSNTSSSSSSNSNILYHQPSTARKKESMFQRASHEVPWLPLGSLNPSPKGGICQLAQDAQSDIWNQGGVSPTRLGKRSSAKREKGLWIPGRQQASPRKRNSQYSGLTAILLSPPWQCLLVFFPQRPLVKRLTLISLIRNKRLSHTPLSISSLCV